MKKKKLYNYQLTISYDGTRYNGWQKQHNTQNTIQGILETQLSLLLEEAIELHGSGRTDAGVHARMQCASFKTTCELLDPSAFTLHINELLPDDIRITGCYRVDGHFHARLSATGKHYTYQLDTRNPSSVFLRRYSYPVEKPIDINAMKAAATHLTGVHDFRAFCTRPAPDKSTVREIYSITFLEKDGILAIHYKGNGFLYNMVRILSGTLLAVGQHSISPDAISAIIKSKDRTNAGPTLPGNALFLTAVSYQKNSSDDQSHF